DGIRDFHVTGVQTCALPIYLSPYHVTATISSKCFYQGRGRWLVTQAFVRRKSRLRVKGLKVKDKEKIKEAIAISIQNGSYTTRRSEERRVGKECRTRQSQYI